MFLYTFIIFSLIYFFVVFCLYQYVLQIYHFIFHPDFIFSPNSFLLFHICLEFFIYGKGYDHRFLRLQYHWHIELYNWSCPLVFLASLSCLFLIEILFLQVFFFLTFLISFPFSEYFVFSLFPFSSEINFEIYFSYLRLEILFSDVFFRKIPLSLKLFCWDYNSIRKCICQYYLHIFFKYFHILLYAIQLSEFLEFDKLYRKF